MASCEKNNTCSALEGSLNAESKGKLFGTYLRSSSGSIDATAKEIQVEPDFEEPPIPENFDGRKTWEKFLSPILDQGVCAGCYAYSTVSVLADKYAIQSLLKVKPVFNPLELVMCMIEETSPEDYIALRENIDKLTEEEKKHITKACGGDTIYNAARYLYRAGAVEDSCLPHDSVMKYLKDNGRLPICSTIEGPDLDRCEDNNVAQRLWPIMNAYTIAGEGDELVENIMLDIMKWGPLVLAFNVFPDFINNYDGKTVYIPKTGQKSVGGHAVKVLGWGVENSVPYWLCANSWGTNWGEKGYFKIVRLNKDLELEQNNMSVRPEILSGPSPNLSKLKGLLTEDDLKERQYNNVDPATFYPSKLIPLIKEGKVKGDLTPLFDTSKIPIRSTFYAYLADKLPFMTVSGQVYGIDNIQGATGTYSSRKWIKIVLIILSAFMFIFAAFFIARRLTRKKL